MTSGSSKLSKAVDKGDLKGVGVAHMKIATATSKLRN